MSFAPPRPLTATGYAQRAFAQVLGLYDLHVNPGMVQVVPRPKQGNKYVLFYKSEDGQRCAIGIYAGDGSGGKTVLLAAKIIFSAYFYGDEDHFCGVDAEGNPKRIESQELLRA